MSQPKDDSEQAFLERTRQTLDARVDELDEVTLQRLREARVAALAQRPSRLIRWQPVTAGMAAASVAVIVGALWFGSEQNSPLISGLDDIELLSSVDDIEFYEDLEFYQWLEDEELAG